MKEQIKQKLTFVFKYFIGLALLIWILARVDRQQMIQTLLEIRPTTFALIIVLVFLNLWIQFRRWRYLIEQQSSDFSHRDLIPSFFAGFTFRLILPGGHAEISKIFLLPGKKRGKVMAFAIEKFFQTYVKTILVLAGLPFLFAQFKWLFWSAAILLIVAYPFFPLLLKTRWLQKFQEKEVHYHKIFLRALIFSVGVFLCLMLQYFILLNDAHQIDFNATFLTVIYIWGAGLIPVSVSGLGVRENIAAFVLQRYGIPASTAVGISLLIFIINAIIPALIGVFFIYRRQHHFKDARETLKVVSSQIYNHGKKRFAKNKDTD
ncbi:lysylphosphatidylglycerol synthase transmembrane domain-containing protein [Calditrichota bacterium LG25]